MASASEVTFVARMLLDGRARRDSWPQQIEVMLILADQLDEASDPDLADALRKGRFTVFQRARDGQPVVVPYHEGPIGRDVVHVYSLWLYVDPLLWLKVGFTKTTPPLIGRIVECETVFNLYCGDRQIWATDQTSPDTRWVGCLPLFSDKPEEWH